MAITILKQPDSNHPNLLGLPIEFELYSDNVMAYDGNVAEFTYMHWQNFPTNNKKLRISFLNYNLEFTCSDNPDLSNNEISNSVAGAANEGEAWANTVASELNQHPIIAEHWEVISLGGGQDAFGPWARLKYRAKYKSGALYMPYFSNEAGYINLMRTDAVEGQTPQRKSSFYIVADIYDEYNNRINSLPLVPDSQSKVKFDAAPSLKHLIETKLRVSNSLTGKEFGTYKFFKIKYYERWGKGNWSPIQTSSTYYYMYGNLSHLHRAALNDYNLTWHEDLQTSRSFLTDRATSSYIRLNQYLRFGFLFQNNVSNEKVYYRFSNENGDVVSGSVPLQAPANLFEIWYLNIHHLIESIGQASGGYNLDSKLEYLSFRLFHSSQEYELYILDDLDDGVEFIYRNNWGQYDSIILRGLEKESPDFSKSKPIHHFLGQDFNTNDRAIQSQSSLRQKTFEAHSGLISGNELFMLNSMLISPDVFVRKEGKIIPVVIDKESIKTSDHKRNQMNIKFKYKYAFTDKANSQILNL